jgi:DNA repair protein SbcD/Mre11
MRLVHTSDWHLGRTLHGESLLAHQAAFLDWLLAVAVEQQADAVVVAGDIYDRAVPSTDAVAILDRALCGFADAAIPVLLTSGNHDSAVRLGFASRLSERAGIHLCTSLTSLTRPLIVSDRHGEVGLYGIPYLLPDAVMADLGAERSHESVLAAAAGQIRADAADRSLDRVVVAAHAFVTGAVTSESERDIRVGGIGDAPASVFTGFSYVALGHLHGQQTIAGHLRYSGSPLPYSFSEAAHHKGSWLVELDEDGTARAERVPAPVYRRLSVLRGRLPDLLGSAAFASYEDDFVSVTLTDPSRPEGAMDALRARFPHVLVLTFEPEGAAPDQRGYRARVAGRDDLAIAAEFVTHVRNDPASAAEQRLLAEAFEAVRIGTEADA